MNAIQLPTMRTRLADMHEVVGYRHRTSSGVVYSRDNRSWRSEPLSGIFEEPHSGLRDQGGQLLYWGDIVLIRDAITQRNSHHAVLCDVEQTPRLCNLKTRRVTWLDTGSPMSRQLGMKVGRIGNWGLSESLRATIHATTPLPKYLPMRSIGWNVLSLMAGLLSVALIEWVLTGTVGPISSSLGACTAQALYLGISHKRSNWMSRERLFKLAGCTALVLFIAGVVSPILLSAQWSLNVALVYGISGAIMGGTSTILSGDVVSWVCGGYGGELPKGKWNRLYP